MEEKHTHILATAADTGERYCVICGEVMNDDYIDEMPINKYFSKSAKNVKDYALDHGIELNEKEITAIIYHVSKFYEVKRMRGIQPHLKKNIIRYFIFLEMVKSGRNLDALKVKPSNNQRFISTLKLIGFDNLRLKQIFISMPIIARWID
jgi:hypothetical protein